MEACDGSTTAEAETAEAAAWETRVEKRSTLGNQESILSGQPPWSGETTTTSPFVTTMTEAKRGALMTEANSNHVVTPHHHRVLSTLECDTTYSTHLNLSSETLAAVQSSSHETPGIAPVMEASPWQSSPVKMCMEKTHFTTPPDGHSASGHNAMNDTPTQRTIPSPTVPTQVGEQPRGASPKSCSSLQEGIGCAPVFPQMRYRSLLQPMAAIQDPDEATLVLEQNRNALIAELVRRKKCLQQQLMQMHMEMSSQNIFSLVRASNASRLQYLLENRLCNVNTRDYNGCTPLHVAALEGNHAIVRVLISFGADVLSVDNTGRTPLDWAAANRHGSVCRLLLATTQCLQLMQEQQQRQLQVEKKPVSQDKNTSLGDSSNCNSSSTLTPSQTFSRALPHGGARLSLLQPCTPLDADTVNEQHNETLSGSLLNNCYVRDALPPDIVPLLRAQCASSVSAAPLMAPNVEPLLHEEDDAEVECRIPTFSNYTTVSDTVSLVVCMVGLPGRGKSFIGCRIARYLNWKGVPCRVFNAGFYRRKLLGVDDTAESAFFDPSNTRGRELRDKMANLACDDLVKFILEHRFAVGVFDATNTTRDRRRHLVEFFSRATRHRNVECRVIFIESICTDDAIITENILRFKCGNDDFKNVTDTSEAVASFRSRIAEYEKVYEPLDYDEGVSFIRIVNVKHHVVLHKIPCGLASLIAFFLLNLHPVAYPIYIALPGETEGDRSHMYGGDERLTALGEQYGVWLKRFIMERYVPHTVVLHGTNRSVMNTLRPLAQALEGVENSEEDSGKDDGWENTLSNCSMSLRKEVMCPLPGLDSINYGRFSGRTVAWVRSKYARLSRILYTALPIASVESQGGVNDSFDSLTDHSGEEDHQLRQSARPPSKEHFDKSAHAIRRFRHVPNGTDPRMSYCVQFPNGESCRQVNVRLEPVVMAVMRVQGPVFVVASSVPAQGILAFFTDVLPEMSPTLRLPRHAVVEIGVKNDITVHQCMDLCEEKVVPDKM